MKTVIGIVGGQESGKDTAANYLCQKLGGKKVAIADELKVLTSRMYHLSPGHFSDRELKETVIPYLGRSPRQLMQQVGDALGDTFGKTFLVDRALVRVLYGFDQGQFVVVSDVRYQHEADRIRSWQSSVVDRSLLLKLSYRDQPPAVSHQSETSWQAIVTDLTIPSCAELASLYLELDTIAERLQALLHK